MIPGFEMLENPISVPAPAPVCFATLVDEAERGHDSRTELRLKNAFEALAQIHSGYLQVLAEAQEYCMPRPIDLPAARFHVALKQLHQSGGDFYDVIELGNEQFDYMVADARGHDLSATYWTLALKTLLSEYADLLYSPAEALDRINRALLKILPNGVYFTAIYARLDRARGTVSLLNAAHTPVILQAAGGGELRAIQGTGDVLGCFRDVVFGGVELRVNRGDRIFLFSDGLVESPLDPFRGIEQLGRVIERHKENTLPDQVELVLAEQMNNSPAQDDVLLMGIEV